MSWFAGIAEKAEGFLNKVDQQAATALQKKMNSFSYSPSVVDNQYLSDPASGGAIPKDRNMYQSTNALCSSTPTTSVNKTFSTNLVQSRTSRLQKVDPDAELMEFLNSDDKPEHKITIHSESSNIRSKISDSVFSHLNSSSFNDGSTSFTDTHNQASQSEVVGEKETLTMNIWSSGATQYKPEDSKKQVLLNGSSASQELPHNGTFVSEETSENIYSLGPFEKVSESSQTDKTDGWNEKQEIISYMGLVDQKPEVCMVKEIDGLQQENLQLLGSGVPVQKLNESHELTPVQETLTLVSNSHQDSSQISNNYQEPEKEATDQKLLTSQLEKENAMLMKEVTGMNQEIQNLMKKLEDADNEKKRMQKKLDYWNSQVSGSDRKIRELINQENDLNSALDAKDSQLAVLRVRLQEADLELQAKRELNDSLRAENDRIIKELSSCSELHNQTLQALKDKEEEAELTLKQEQEANMVAKTETMERLRTLEQQQCEMLENLTITQNQLADEKNQNKELNLQMRTLKTTLENTRQELSDYKRKAQRILQSKDRLITSLKETRGINNENLENTSNPTAAAYKAELEELHQERDQLREELENAKISIEALKAELQEMGENFQNEVESNEEQLRLLKEQLEQEHQHRVDLEQENLQNTEELKYLSEDLTHTKTTLQGKIYDRELEIDKLRKQLTARALNTHTQTELESRLRTLTENLIQKQTLVEALSTEKHSLVLQLERLEQQMKDSQFLTPRGPTTVVGLGHSDDNNLQSAKSRVSGFFAESPYDGTMTRRVKKVYGVVDSFSIRLGVFLRRYPMARVFMIFYMVLLHFWVMVVLCTYQPEIHSPNYHPNKTL
ncbi:golgin subfamily A member 5-like isoform X1 [Tachypleus tridentatus]|uniref:golgin subfamily A member 5-like isoform X1 n=1 Tax=Tachypleus tridentatus TaxID=6853 RepID=UPI003FD0FD1D